MKHDLTTGTWQDGTGCPISIILATTSDVGERQHHGHAVLAETKAATGADNNHPKSVSKKRRKWQPWRKPWQPQRQRRQW